MEKEINFEQELYKHFGHVKDFTLCTAIAKRFYEMGKDSNVLRNGKNWKEEPVSEDLEEYANKYAHNLITPELYGYHIVDAIKAGAKWQEKKDQDVAEITRKEIVEKVTNYLNSKLYDWVQISHFGRREYPDTIMKQNFIYNLKQAMKDD